MTDQSKDKGVDEPGPVLQDEVAAATADTSRRVGRYVVLSTLGRGGMGVVYRCWDPDLQRLVAVKQTIDPKGAHPVELARFQREAKTLANLSHPGIVQIMDVGEHQDTPFIVLELVQGRSFQDIYEDHRPSPATLGELAAQIADALHYAHDHGVVHRDVKPANVLIDETGRARLLDFGLARVMDDKTRLTQPGSAIGTPYFMAPEQISDDFGEIGPHTDIYGLGGLIYWGLTGHPPFDVEAVMNLLHLIMTANPSPPSEAHPDVHPGLEQLAMRCLAKLPQRRFSSAKEVARELRSGAHGQVEAPSPPTRKSRIAILAVTGLVALGTVTFWLARAVSFQRRPTQANVTGSAQNDSAAGSADASTPNPGPSAKHELTPPEGAEVASASPPPKPSKAPSARELSSQARVLLRQHRVLESIETYTRAIEIDPNLADAWLGRGAAHLNDGNQRAAIADLNHAIEILPKSSSAWYLRGKARKDHGDLDGAIADLSQALAIDPGNPEFWGMRSKARMMLGDSPGADADYAQMHELRTSSVSALTSLIEHNRQNVAVWVRRATVRAQAGDLQEAIRDLSQAILVSPGHVLALALRGKLRLETGDVVAAIADEDRALELDPLYANAWIYRGQARLRTGDGESAVADLTRAIEIDPTMASAWKSRAMARVSMGHISDALNDYSQAIEIEPKDSSCWRLLGEALLLLGDYPHALERLSQAALLDDSNAMTFHLRGEAHARNQESERAISDFTRAVSLAPEQFESWESRGVCRAIEGDLQGAIADLSHAIELAPARATPWNHRGRARLEGKDHRGALADFSQALTLEPNLAIAWRNRGYCHLQLDNEPSAIADWQHFLELAPGHPLASTIRQRLRDLMAELRDPVLPGDGR